MEALRDSAAEMVHADRDEIAIVPNTSFGINMVAEGFPWREGENVVIAAGEFPANVYPWLNLKNRGVQTRVVPLDDGRICLDRIAQACL